jgi:hypothetical protein
MSDEILTATLKAIDQAKATASTRAQAQSSEGGGKSDEDTLDPEVEELLLQSPLGALLPTALYATSMLLKVSEPNRCSNATTHYISHPQKTFTACHPRIEFLFVFTLISVSISVCLSVSASVRVCDLIFISLQSYASLMVKQAEPAFSPAYSSLSSLQASVTKLEQLLPKEALFAAGGDAPVVGTTEQTFESAHQ